MAGRIRISELPRVDELINSDLLAVVSSGTTSSVTVATIKQEIGIVPPDVLVLDDGGNPRGNGSINLQTGRDNEAHVSSGLQSISIGYDAHAIRYSAISIGPYSKADGERSISIGRSSSTSGSASIGLGFNSIAHGNDIISIGRNASSSTEGSIVIGRDSQSSGTDSIAIGRFTQVSHSNAVVIGSGTDVLPHTSVRSDSVSIGRRNLEIQLDGGGIFLRNISSHFLNVNSEGELALDGIPIRRPLQYQMLYVNGSLHEVTTSDLGKIIVFDSIDPCTVILPPGLSDGFFIQFRNRDSGEITIVTDSSEVIEGAGNVTEEPTIPASVYKESSNVWTTVGALRFE